MRDQNTTDKHVSEQLLRRNFSNRMPFKDYNAFCIHSTVLIFYRLVRADWFYLSVVGDRGCPISLPPRAEAFSRPNVHCSAQHSVCFSKRIRMNERLMVKIKAKQKQ